jgi:hypothetical protein
MENYIKEDCFVCKPTDGGAMLMEVLGTVNDFLEENEINWENCIALYTSLTDPSQHLDTLQDFRHWQERKPLLLSGHTVCFTDTCI